MKTHSGADLDFLAPKNINLEDVALGLSRQPRFAGQTSKPFSVAQHSLLVARLCPLHALQALLHDAQEAFLGDIPTPAKEAMRTFGRSPYDELEKRLHTAIAKSVGIDPEIPVSVHLADRKARDIEGAVLHPAWKKKSHKEIADLLELPDGGRELWLSEVRKHLESPYKRFREERSRTYAMRGG